MLQSEREMMPMGQNKGMGWIQREKHCPNTRKIILRVKRMKLWNPLSRKRLGAPSLGTVRMRLDYSVPALAPGMRLEETYYNFFISKTLYLLALVQPVQEDGQQRSSLMGINTEIQ